MFETKIKLGENVVLEHRKDKAKIFHEGAWVGDIDENGITLWTEGESIECGRKLKNGKEVSVICKFK